jgi:hypothetical protein
VQRRMSRTIRSTKRRKKSKSGIAKPDTEVRSSSQDRKAKRKRQRFGTALGRAERVGQCDGGHQPHHGVERQLAYHSIAVRNNVGSKERGVRIGPRLCRHTLRNSDSDLTPTRTTTECERPQKMNQVNRRIQLYSIERMSEGVKQRNSNNARGHHSTESRRPE